MLRLSAGTGQMGQARWDGPAGEDSWDMATLAGQPLKKRYKRTVRKDRTGLLGRTTKRGQP
jgi:hypothetical protein